MDVGEPLATLTIDKVVPEISLPSNLSHGGVLGKPLIQEVISTSSDCSGVEFLDTSPQPKGYHYPILVFE